MNELSLNAISHHLTMLSDAELASLIIEFVSSDGVGTALGEETFRRLTALRTREAVGLLAAREILEVN